METQIIGAKHTLLFMNWVRYMRATYEKPGVKNVVVVLGHGFGCDSTCWHNLRPVLSRRGYGVLVYDLPYARTSSGGAFDEAPNRRKVFRAALERFMAAKEHRQPQKGPPFDFDRYSSLEGYANDLICLIDEVKVRRCIFVGHSVSGMIGLLASTKRPELFRTLIMLASSPRYMNDPSCGYVGGFDQEQLRDLLDNVEHNYEDWASGFATIAVEEPNDAAVKQFTTGLLAVRPDIALATCKTIFLMDLRDTLPKVSVSCVILQSRSDVAVPLSVGAYVADVIRGSERVVLPTAGHLPHLSSPLVVNSTLLRYIEQYVGR